jgi:hypothetical protein
LPECREDSSRACVVSGLLGAVVLAVLIVAALLVLWVLFGALRAGAREDRAAGRGDDGDA